MKKYIFTLNPDDFLYAKAVHEFLAQGGAARVDSICIFPSRASFSYQLSYTLASIQIMGWMNILPRFLGFQISAFFRKLSGSAERHSIRTAAAAFGIPVYEFRDVNGSDFRAHVESRGPKGILNVCSQIYKKDTLARLPPIYNFHGGYLPGNRGRFPMFWAYVKKIPQYITCHRVSEVIDGGESIYHHSLPNDPKFGVDELMMLTIDLFPEVMKRSISLIDENRRQTITIPFPNFYGKQPTGKEISEYHVELSRTRSGK